VIGACESPDCPYDVRSPPRWNTGAGAVRRTVRVPRWAPGKALRTRDCVWNAPVPACPVRHIAARSSALDVRHHGANVAVGGAVLPAAFGLARDRRERRLREPCGVCGGSPAVRSVHDPAFDNSRGSIGCWTRVSVSTWPGDLSGLSGRRRTFRGHSRGHKCLYGAMSFSDSGAAVDEERTGELKRRTGRVPAAWVQTSGGSHECTRAG